MQEDGFLRALLRRFNREMLWSFKLTNSAEHPNILWLTCEDNNVDWVGCYGNRHANTPHIDQLAREGFQYMNAFASAPVCAPSRFIWITGITSAPNGGLFLRRHVWRTGFYGETVQCLRSIQKRTAGGGGSFIAELSKRPNGLRQRLRRTRLGR